MKSRFILELNLLASIESNLEFLEKCERQIKEKRKKLKSSIKQPKNQLDLEEESKK